MAGRTREARQDELIDRLAEFSNARARTSFLRRHNQLWEPAVVERLYARVVRLARIDLQRTDRLAQAATWVAEKLDDAGCRAQSLRATGHVRFIRGKYSEALEHYDTAVKLFRRAGREVDVARTLNGSLQSLISARQVQGGAHLGPPGAADLRATRGRAGAGTSRQQRGQHPLSPGPVRRGAGAL